MESKRQVSNQNMPISGVYIYFSLPKIKIGQLEIHPRFGILHLVPALTVINTAEIFVDLFVIRLRLQHSFSLNNT